MNPLPFLVLLMICVPVTGYTPMIEEITTPEVVYIPQAAYVAQTDIYNWDEQMVMVASTLVGETRQDTVNNTLVYVATHLEYDYETQEQLMMTNYYDNRTATEVFHDRNAICIGYSRLLVSLLRINNIEAASVSGWVDGEGAHEWVKISTEGNGWVEYEPQWGLPIDDSFTHM